ncbi:hypothetical protein BaRGS_00029524 [Batillaria attramentaria]|uniref:FHF complex subunit HOOK-interacting protein C-terminal domain-containing protein n=1 Tax=Batillaria attramentaria TaxID=370345 RepID=A0ABD0JVT7_9CAEN
MEFMSTDSCVRSRPRQTMCSRGIKFVCVHKTLCEDSDSNDVTSPQGERQSKHARASVPARHQVKMSWFKRTSSVRDDGRVAVNGRGSPGRDRTNTDPDTCFEVFKNHWQQASNVINATSKKNGSSSDDVETVVHNFEQMVTLLVGEEGIDGMPGPIAHFLLEKDVFETFCNWCSSQRQHQDKLCMEQLRMYELLISQSRQLLLIHRPVIRPLLRLLMACAEPQLPNSGSEELEFRLVLVLHQICTCISQETVILESFFSTEADHGPAKFLIFSLLIPYIHREGPIGQRARDALLLLMTLSARHPHIGHYIAENSDFCPVLATGLSGLYSSLPRKITPPSDDWFALTEDDCQRIVDLQMFLNSLEFCNAVVQVAHPLVRDQLIKFIYTGFLLPVLGPALHQNSRDEVMTATAYLDLFLRRISEPHLIRAFLRFLSLISLSLFHTLIDLNCEEVMFHLVFKYLIPCTHVMVSQRRAVRDLDLYGKSAEKFLSLRRTDVGRSASISTPAELAKVPTKEGSRRRSSGIFRSRKEKKKLEALPEDDQKAASDSTSSTSAESLTDDASLLSESSYVDYLGQSHKMLKQCAHACRNWSAPYDGERPPPDSDLDPQVSSADGSGRGDVIDGGKGDAKEEVAGSASNSVTDKGRARTGSSVKLLSHGNVADTGCVHMPDSESLTKQASGSPSADGEKGEAASQTSKSRSPSSEKQCNTVSHSSSQLPKLDPQRLSKLFSCLDNLDSFLACLNEMDLPSDIPTETLEGTLATLDSLLSSVSFKVVQGSGARKYRGSSSSSARLSESSTPDREESGRFESHSATQATASAPSGEADTSVAISVTDSSVTSAQSATSKTPPAPPKSLGLAPAKDFSLGGKLNVMSPLRTPDDMWRGFMSPTSPGFSFQPSSSSSSLAGQRPTLTALRYSNAPPNTGPFLSAVFQRLEGMVQNSLYANLLLTGLVTRLATYPQPLLRSFLLNVNLVFQPTVKSLVQVLSSVRQKVDSYAVTTRNFGVFMTKARRNLKLREDFLVSSMTGVPSPHLPNIDCLPGQMTKPRAATVSDIPAEKKKMSLTDLLFRRSPRQRQNPGSAGRKGQHLQRVEVAGGVGYRFINSIQQDTPENPEESIKTWNAVYCALVLEEFLKELAALSLEHSVLNSDDGYFSS